MRKIRILLFAVLLIAAGTFLCIYVCNKIIEDAAKGKLYSNVHNIPFNKVGLLLGTSKSLSARQLNPYYVYRIEAAVNLLKAGKIKYIIVSGNNDNKGYNEPALMKADLIRAGIEPAIIFPDNAG